MISEKTFNNNVVLARDDDNVEWVVVGRGIGFGCKPGDQVDKDKIEQRYVAVEEGISLADDLARISPDAISLTMQIIQAVEPLLNVKFTSYQLASLADHINFTLQRSQQENDAIEGTVKWEIKNLFAKEYQAAEVALQILNEHAKVILPEGEAVLLAYHFINTCSEKINLSHTIKITKLISNIIEIVQYQYGMILDHESFNFNRFVTHLRTFMIKHLTHVEDPAMELDPDILKLMKAKYPQAYATVLKVSSFLQKKEGWQLHPDDEVYLTLHVWRVTQRQIIE
ncbi:PRD domain-containing protein [Bombilactobacillus thymidiniphilus]|uniref:PRD domain-containing protein n=1 Tax=Bombilactobacillus thymidiniphilus TaxID=2923363 RepID=A0ABY4PET2_9LACO|nr:PRD domain-containing protein [Bombilactobacillus thymidiniphilus]UQS84075.1 PRD domain-containing protein [Bombilactobacillus thymidiniphilus]